MLDRDRLVRIPDGGDSDVHWSKEEEPQRYRYVHVPIYVYRLGTYIVQVPGVTTCIKTMDKI
jgi:hypothetical protein